DSICIEYHPNSGIPARTVLFEGFNRYRGTEPELPMDRNPWYYHYPYVSRINFEFAKFSLDASLSKKEITRLLDLIHCIRELTFTSYTDVQNSWAAASSKLTPFTQDEVTVSYKNKPQTHPVYTRDVWEYLKDLLHDPYLVSQMDWNAHRLYHFDEGTQEFVLPQCPLLLIVYADKTKLSSFGSAKGYPVILKCGNLPVDICNGEGLGGGRVVGWLPILDEKAGEKHKTGYVNLKRVVWHESFRKILGPILKYSHHGVWFHCGDGADRCLCPCIAILSSDYEEQCFMLLIRGGMGLFPCPICLVPKGQLCNHRVQFPLRLGEDAQEILDEAMSMSTQKQREAVLQSWSLWPVQNTFLELGHSDPYKALSFDRLHAFHSGLFGHHLWVEFKKHVEGISNDAVKLIDNHFNAFPRWSGLTHFVEVMGLSFTDGGKYEHISKNILFTSHSVVTRTASPVGYQLLRLIRAYVEMDTYAGLPLHTTWTIQDGKHSQAVFSARLQEYIEYTADDPGAKNWDFPKAHTHQHLFEDIIAKGVTCNYNTKPNEKLHQLLKKAYRMTNGRNVASQILTIDHNAYVAQYMQQQLERFDDCNKAQLALAEDCNVNNLPDEPIGGGHFSLGARQPVQGIASLLEAHSDDVAYQNFLQCLGSFLTREYKAHQIPLPNGRRVTLTDTSQISEYRLLRINFESLADWREETDLLHCNPLFYGQPRYDCVLVNVAPSFFARLILLFTCRVGDHIEPLALIQPFDRMKPSPKDQDLGLFRVHRRPRQQAEFISLHTVVRGALLIPDFGREGDYLVHNLIDSDMYLRIKGLKGS
ncbi:hypothetical protein PYCCODRAFT_1368332, partial [Trametes coccinea BRFM310]